MKFTEFTLHPDVLIGIEKTGYVDCTPVQEQVLQAALNGDDLYVQSQTGTGKTAAFLISIMQELLTRPEAAGKKALIMVPTRELAVQVEEEAAQLCAGTSLKCGSFYGGVGYAEQTTALKNNVDILVGTPGRVIDLQESRTMDLSQVAFLVIDEADRMFDMGFYPDLRKLIGVLPKTKDRQTMLFSATLNAYVKNLAWEYTENPKEITIDAGLVTVDEIDQSLFHISSDEKTRLLLGILQKEKPESVLVFCNTKKTCEIVAKRLRLNGFESEFIIGDLPQVKRQKVLNSFKAGKIACLIATDVAARGIDVDDLAMVVNYDLPNEAENYVHRIGRTARAGKTGKAYTFCSEQDVYNLTPIERYVGKAIPVAEIPEDLLAEDKSAGVYIKLANYDDERDDRRNGGDRRSGNDRRSERGGRHDGDTRRSSRDGERKTTGSRKPEKRGPNPAQRARPERASGDTDAKLLGLSVEERMKFYREKYAGGNQRPQRQGQGKQGQHGQQQRQRSGNTQQARPQNARDCARMQGKPQTAQKSAPMPQTTVKPPENAKGSEKRGLLAKIKSLIIGRK